MVNMHFNDCVRGEPPLFHSWTALPWFRRSLYNSTAKRRQWNEIDFSVWEAGKSIDNSVFHHSPRFAEKQSNVPQKKVPAATEVRQFSLIQALIPGQMLYHGKALALSSTPSVVYPNGPKLSTLVPLIHYPFLTWTGSLFHCQRWHSLISESQPSAEVFAKDTIASQERTWGLKSRWVGQRGI